MHEPLREAFDGIHATERLKQRTGEVLRQRLAQGGHRRPSPLRYAALCCAMLALVLLGAGGYHVYMTPVSYISVDVNPSVELGLNRLDRVVTVTAFNEDGAAIIEDLALKNRPYTEAIELLLADDSFARYLTGDALLSFTVVSDQEEVLLAGIQACHGYAQANAECHGANTQLVEEAHHSGLSVGKYQAYLELSQHDSSITAEDCMDLSMRQIRDLISRHQSGADAPALGGQGGGHHGQGGGHGYGYRGGMGRDSNP